MQSIQFWTLFALALPAAIRTRRTAVRRRRRGRTEQRSVGDGPGR
jgi:hypothetical protein